MSIAKHSKPQPNGGSPRPARVIHRGARRARALAVPAWLAVVACALTGCGRGPQAKGAGVPPRSGSHAASPAKEVEIQEDPVKTGIEAGDASLASKVRGRLADDPRLRALRIEVDAEAGRVTLWGHVGSAEQRAAAEQQARRTPGVGAVINLIKVDT